jgi:hypothetical protein
MWRKSRHCADLRDLDCVENAGLPLDGVTLFVQTQQVLPVPLPSKSEAGRNPQTGAAVTRKVYQPTTTLETGVKGERK